MAWRGSAAALLAVVLPAAARAVGPIPPGFPPPATGVYLVAGPLSNYVPATAQANGSITVRVAWANAPAAYAVGSTLTFPITTATRVIFPLAIARRGPDRNVSIRDGVGGQVRVVTGLHVSTAAGLQALPATSVFLGRLFGVTDVGRTP